MIIGQELIHIVSAPALFYIEIKSVMRKGVRHLGKFSFVEKGSGTLGSSALQKRGQTPPVIYSFSLNWTFSLFSDNFTHFLFEKVEKR